MKRLFLSGGGDAPDSKLLDEVFIGLIPTDKKLLYIPIAWKGGDLEGCREWFGSMLAGLGFSNFEMWKELAGKTYEDLDEFGAIYIGGGNTFSLLHDFRKSGFDLTLRDFIDSGRPVYGGSAGALILGKDIGTASFGGDADTNDVGLENLAGLGLVGDYAIQCHYLPDQDEEIHQFVAGTGLPVLALGERTGVDVADDRMAVRGFEPAYIFKGGQKTTHEPNSVMDL